MKRLVFCFDGSWNKLTAASPTNVVLVAESVRPTAKDGTVQIVYYDEGVGTATDDRIRGGAFGEGLLTNVREAYRFLIFNYEPGDEIFAFGFSRGAFTARSFVGFIRCAGIPAINNAGRIDDALKLYQEGSKAGPDHASSDAARQFRLANSPRIFIDDDEEEWRCARVRDYAKGSGTRLIIKYVGVWDTVGALGVPAMVPGAAKLNASLGYHRCDLTTGIEYARHAVAIDERRSLFAPTLWDNVDELNRGRGAASDSIHAPYQQKWFPGGHGSVGGGGPERGLSDGALGWLLAGARRAGLQLNAGPDSRIYEIDPKFGVSLFNDPGHESWHDRGAVGWLKAKLLTQDRAGPTRIWEVSAAARRRWNADPGDLHEKTLYRPATLSAVAADLDRPAGQTQQRFTITGTLAEHKIARGDTLSKLARDYLGDVALADAIAEANRDRIDDPDEIYAGQVLRIPKLG